MKMGRFVLGLSLAAAVGVVVAGSAWTAAAPTPSVFVSANGSDSGRCTQAAPCQSFYRGYRVAKPGQIVQVAAGTYPSQSIGVDNSKTSSSDVIIQAAPGAKVVVDGDLDVSGSHFTLRNVAVTSQTTVGYGSAPTDVTLQNIDGENFNIYGGSSFITFKGGDWGPTTCSDGHSGGA